MSNQVKYVMQGVLLTALAILIFYFISLLSSVRFTELKSSVIDYDGVVQSDQNSSTTVMEGQKMFYANCASCHAVHKQLTGPALAGFEQRGPWKERKEVYAWIRNPEKYMKRSIYTVKLYKKYQVMMTSFPDFTNEEIDAVIDYINQNTYQYNLPLAIR